MFPPPECFFNIQSVLLHLLTTSKGVDVHRALFDYMYYLCTYWQMSSCDILIFAAGKLQSSL